MYLKYLLTTTLFIVVLNLHAQINWSDSTAQAITYWEMYDSVTYEIKLEKLKILSGDTTHCQSEIHDSGWVLHSKQFKETQAAESRDVEIRTIIMK